jgi:hypothetical protein
MKMHSEDWSARAEAYTEAANHLELEWTSDTRERHQGAVLVAMLRREAIKCHTKAASVQSVAMVR